MRLLLIWAQIHPALGTAENPGRIQVGAAQAADAEDFDTGRRWDPDTDLDRAKVDAAMAADPPTSIDDFLALLAGEVQKETGYHVGVQAIRPREEVEVKSDEPEPEKPAEPTA